MRIPLHSSKRLFVVISSAMRCRSIRMGRAAPTSPGPIMVTAMEAWAIISKNRFAVRRFTNYIVERA